MLPGKHYQPHSENKFKGTQMFIVVSQENSRANLRKCFLPGPAPRFQCTRLEPFTFNPLLIHFVLLSPASCPFLGIQISLSLLWFPHRVSGRMAVSAEGELGVGGGADGSLSWTRARGGSYTVRSHVSGSLR